MDDKEWRLLSARRASDGRITLIIATPGGSAREVPISDLAATVLIRDLATILTATMVKAQRRDDTQ